MEFAGPEPELQPGEERLDPYLPEFNKLGEQIFLYKPATETTSESQTSGIQPDLIIICSWMGAQPRYIKKYTKPYQMMYPQSPILLLRQDGADLFWRPLFLQRKAIQPALSVIQQLVEEKRSTKPRVLVHIFSNGGSYTASQLTAAYRDSSPSKDKLLPISALVLDSTPSLPSSRRAHTAISESLPKSGPLRTLGSVAVWGYIGMAQTIETISGSDNITIWLRKKLNDPEGAFMQDGLKRLYIYSQADALIPAEDVEAHANEAISIIGKDRVQLEDFVSSRHVGHAMLDEKRYWGLIETLWKDMTA